MEDSSNIVRFIMTVSKQPIAIVAACFVLQFFLIGTFPNSSIGVGAKFVMEAFRMAATAVVVNVATLYTAFLLTGTKRVTLERTTGSLAFDCIFDDVRIKNQDGNIRGFASAKEFGYPNSDASTASTEAAPILHKDHIDTSMSARDVGSPTNSASTTDDLPEDVLHGRKRSASTHIKEGFDLLGQKTMIETPFKISDELRDFSPSVMSRSIFSPSNLRSPSNTTDGRTNSFHSVKPSTPPTWLGRKMMDTTSPVTMETPPSAFSTRSVKSRRSTPFHLPRKMYFGKSKDNASRGYFRT